MKRIARWSAIFLLLCSILLVGTASGAMIIKNNMSALGTLNTINQNQTPQGKASPLERLARELMKTIGENADWDDPEVQDVVKSMGVMVVKKDTQPPESLIGDAIFDHLGDTSFNVPEMNGNLLILGGILGDMQAGKIDRLYVMSDEDVRLNIGAAAEIQELILVASGDVTLEGDGLVGSTIVLDTPKDLNIGVGTNLINLSDNPLNAKVPTGDIVLNPGKNLLVPGQQLTVGNELTKATKNVSLNVRFRLVDQSAQDMQFAPADWDGAVLTEIAVQYTGENCPMGAVNVLDGIAEAFAEKYPELQEQYVLLPEIRSEEPWSKVYRLSDGTTCFAEADGIYLSRAGDVVFPLTGESALDVEFPVYVYRFGEQDGRVTYRIRISGARPDYFTPSLTLRSGGKAEFTFDKESGEWVTSLRRSDFGENENDRIHLTGLRGEETEAFLTVTGREAQRVVTLTWTADTQRTTIDAQNVLWESDTTAQGNDLLCKAGEPVTVRIAPAAGYRGINVALSDPKIAFAVSEENDAISFLMPYAPLTLTLTANQIYTVTLDANGGEELAPLDYTVAESLILPTPTREGYTFLGWTGEGITEPQLTVEIPVGSTGNRHYTAKWQTVPYIITFDTNGGEPLDAISYTVEDEVTLPTPVRAGYDFFGWTDRDSGEAQMTAIIPKGTTGDKAYIAGWTPIEYTITLDANGGDPISTIRYTVTSDAITLPKPIRTGYLFLGWTGEGITEAQENVEIPKGSMGDRNYTANWQPILYIITLMDVNGAGTSETMLYTVENTVTLSPEFRTGYTFLGWTGNGETTPQQTIVLPIGTTGDKTYTANWEATEYTITLDVSGGDPIPSIRYTVESDAITLPRPTRTGYTFLGWTGEGITEAQENVEISQGSTGDRTYTAEWQPIVYTITLLEADGAGTSDEILYTVEDGVVLSSQYLEGYDFLGWTGEGVVNPQETITIPRGSTGNRTYTANWKATVYTITLDTNGGDPLDAISYTIENELSYLPTPTRKGYTFIGWTRTGSIDTPQKFVVIPSGSTGDRTYTANWELVTYSIQIWYRLNQMEDAYLRDVTYTVETPSFNLPKPTFEGYQFVCWIDYGEMTYAEVSIPRGSTEPKERKYIAFFTKLYTITLDTNGGDALAPIQYTVYTDSFTLPTPTRTGYTFTGWTLNGSSGEPQTTVTIPRLSKGDKTYTAQWTPTEYVITLDLNGGSGEEKVLYTAEDEDFELPTPKRDGYTFKGWTGEGIDKPQTSVIIPKGTKGNKAYTANWELVTYTIEIWGFLDDGSTVSLPSVTYTVETPDFNLPKPTYGGYQFLWWYISADEHCDEISILRGSTGAKNYVAFFTQLFTITLDTNGGDTLNPIQYTNQTDSFTLPTPTRTGYTFTGWTLNGSSGEPQTTVTIPRLSKGDKTYTAQWTPTEYAITLNLNGGSGEEKVLYTAEDEDFTLPTPTRLGYEFRGWSGENIGLQKNVTIPKGTTGNKTYTANWKVIQYTLTVISHGEVVEQTKYTVEDKVIYLTAGDEPGYTFLGWQEEGTEDVFRTLYYNKGTTGDKTIYKLWTLTEFTITLNLDGGSGEEKVTYTVEDADFELPTPKRDGYTFKGWTGEGITEPQTSVVIPTGSTAHRTYTANWEAITHNVLIVCIDDETSTVLKKVNVVCTVGQPIPIQNIDGYELMYFNVAGHTVKPMENVAQALWEQCGQNIVCDAYYVKLTHSITFDTNGGEPIDTIWYSKYADPFDLPIPTREGYEFWGWLCGDIGLSEPGTRTIDPSDTPRKITCKAQWKEIHTITLDTNGGEPLAPLQYKYNTEAGRGYTLFSDPITLPIPTRVGYDFVGWTGEGFNTPTKNLTVPNEATGDLTYTAHWQTLLPAQTYAGSIQLPVNVQATPAPAATPAPRK